MALKAQAQFTNPYERAHATYSSSPYFNENAWKQIASGGDASNLDMYIYAVDKNTKELSYDKFKHKYDLSMGNTDTYLAALYNEAFASHIANDDRYQVNVYKYDDAGNMLYDENGNPKVEKKTVSEYEYNKMVINQQAENLRKEFLEKTYAQERDPSFWGAVGETVVDVAYDGMIEFFNKLGTAVYTLGEMTFTDKTFSEDWFSSWESNYKPVLERIVVDGKTAAEAVEEHERKYSSWRDDNGNYTTVGRWANGIATTSGEILASTILGQIATLPWSSASAGTGAAATAAKITTDVISTTLYYAPMATYSMGEQYKQIIASGGSVTAGQMFRNQLLKTGLEIAVERTLGGIFGKTELDKMLFGSQGGKIASKLGKANFGRGVLHVLGEAGQEGLEEFLQEWSSFIVDNCYGMIADSDFKQELNLQNFIDAAVIGALTSGAHSMIGVAATKTTEITDSDGKTHKLGKFASYYYNANIASLSKTLKKAMKDLDTLFKTMPYNSRVEYLTKQRTEIENALNDIENRAISESGQMFRYEQAIATETGLGDGYALNDNLELIKSHEQTAAKDQKLKDKLSKKLADVNFQLKSLEAVKNAGKEFAADEKAWLAQLDKTDVTYDFADDATPSSIIQHFDKLYAAAAAIQSFGYAIGETRLVAAEKILNEIKKLGAEGKFDVDSVAKARNDIVKELKLSGVTVEKSLTGKIARSSITKIKHIFKRGETNNNLSNADLAKGNKFADKVFSASKKRKVVAIADDGKMSASTDEVAIVSKSEFEKGAATYLHSEAEQRLIDSICSYSFKGDVLDEVLTVYRKMYKEDATQFEAVQALLFDEGFFLAMLTGENVKNAKLNLADSNMFALLASLDTIEKSVVVDDIREGVYKTKIATARKAMAKALTAYLKIQPYADYNLDILTKSQKDEIRKYRESFAVGNRIVEGKMTNDDSNYIYRKINLMPVSDEDKKKLIKTIESDSRDEKRKALVKIDEVYYVAFYGSYDGKIYLPTNRIGNRAFNNILYQMGLTASELLDAKLDDKTIESIKKSYGEMNTKSLVRFYSEKLKVFTGNRYQLKITTEAESPENGIFTSGKSGTRLKIVDTKSNFESPNIASIRNHSTKTHVRPTSAHTATINQLLSDDAKKKGSGYYTVDDLITNVSLIKESLRKNIEDRYGEVTPNTVYSYLKVYLPTKGNFTVNVGADGVTRLVSYTSIKQLLASNISKEMVVKVINGELPFSALVDEKYRIPLMDECVLKAENSPEYYTHMDKIRNVGVKTPVIKITRANLSNLEQIKIELSHEIQHLVQEVTMMNTGLNGDVLSLFDSDTKSKVIQSVLNHVPNIRRMVGNDTKKAEKLVNDFLYYSSGETSAYGAELSNEVKFYPVLVQDNDGVVDITLPWGDTFKSNEKRRQAMKMDRLQRTKDLLYRIGEGQVTSTEITDMLSEMFSIDPSMDIPVELKNKVLAAYKSSYGDGKIKFVPQSEIDAIKNDRKYAGLYSESDGILISRDVLIERLLNNDYASAAKTILHELVHAVTYHEVRNVIQIVGDAALKVYLETGIEGPSIKALDETQLAALSLIKLHHDLSKDESSEMYALKDAYEMVAELVNPKFRTYLKGKNILSKLLDFIKRLFGINVDNALEAADLALNSILEYQIAEDVSISDAEYLDNAKLYESLKNDVSEKSSQKFKKLVETLRNQVRKAANKNGFYSTMLYHGTNKFGFTKLDVSKSDDSASFFASSSLRTSSTYTSDRSTSTREISSSVNDYFEHRVNSTLEELVDFSNELIEIFNKAFPNEKDSYDFEYSIGSFVDNFWEESAHLNHREVYNYLVDTFNTFYADGDTIHISTDNGDLVFGADDSSNIIEILRRVDVVINDLTDILLYGNPGVYSFYGNLDNALVVEGNGVNYDKINFENNIVNTRTLFKIAVDRGYDAVLVKDIQDSIGGKIISDVYIFRDPSRQLKSADLVTYDDKGEIIPLSKRFEPLVPDIRWDVAEDSGWLGDAVDEKPKRPTLHDASDAHMFKKGVQERSTVSRRATGRLAGFRGRPVSLAVQRFAVESAKIQGLDEVLDDKVKNGTLIIEDLQDFVRDANPKNKMHCEVFKLINECLYHNKHITSLEQLEEYVVKRTANYYGMRRYLKDLGRDDELIETDDPKLYENFVEALNKADESIAEKYKSIVRHYYGSPSIEFVDDEPNDGKSKKKKSKKKIERESVAFEISDKYLRILYMQRFDGSVASGGAIAAAAKVMAYNEILLGWRVKGGSLSATALSMEEEVGEGKDKDSTLMRGETIADEDSDPSNWGVEKPSSYDYYMADEVLGGDLEIQLIAEMSAKIQAKYVKMIEDAGGPDKFTRAQSLKMIEDLNNEVSEMKVIVENLHKRNDPEYYRLLDEHLIGTLEERKAKYLHFLLKTFNKTESDVTGMSLNEVMNQQEQDVKDVEKLKHQMRKGRDIVANIKSLARTIRRNLSDKDAKLFLKDNSDLFTEDLTVHPSLYSRVLDSKNPEKTKTGHGRIVYLDDNTLRDLERRLQKLSIDVQYGTYQSIAALKYRRQAERSEKKRMKKFIDHLVNYNNGTKTKYVAIYRSGDEVEFDGDVEAPEFAKRFMNNTAEMINDLEGEHMEVAKSKTQFLVGDNEHHVKMNYNRFIEFNKTTLVSLTQDNVNELVEFFLHASSANPLFASVELWTLEYILKMAGENDTMFKLSDAQHDAIVNHLRKRVETAGTTLRAWADCVKNLKAIDFTRALHKAMLLECGIELSLAVEGELIMAIKTGDIERIKKAKDLAYNEALTQYKGKKRTIFERLLRYEQMAMLSGPGTWIRNGVSNRLLTYSNKFADWIGSFLPESKYHKQHKQYKLVGTEIGDGYAKWIDSAVIDSGLLDLISDGLLKYDPRQAKKSGNDNQLIKLITAKIQSDLFNNSNDGILQWFQDKIKWAMSDKKFIDKAFKVYLGKMLTEDSADVSEGIKNADVMNAIADAYIMALQDYMHTKGFFGKIEDAMQTYLHKHFNPTLADGAFFVYKQVMPFANASWNWFVEGLRYTPLGLVKGVWNLCRLERTINAMEDARQKGEIVRSGRFAEYLAKRNIGKGVIGTFTFAVGILLSSVFDLVGFDDDDDEYKLRINGLDGPIYFDMGNLFGTSGLAMGMTLAQTFKDADGFNFDLFMDATSNVLTTMFRESTFADMFNTFRYDNSIGDYILNMPLETAGRFFPRFISGFATLMRENKLQYSSGVVGKLEKFAASLIPHFDKLPFMAYKVDPYTGDTQLTNDAWFGVNLWNMIMPIKVKNYGYSNREAVAISLGLRKAQLSGNYEVKGVKVKLSASEIQALNEFYGKLNAKDIDDFINGKTTHKVENEDGEIEELKYSKMTDGQKKAVIEQIMSNNGQIAKVYILTSTQGYKYYASESEYERLKNAKVNRNVYRKVDKKNVGFVKN